MRVDGRLYLITDRKQLVGLALLEALEQALRAGVQIIQLREKDLTPIELYELGRKVIRICQNYRAKLLINDRADIARAIEASGVHLTSVGIPPYEARKCLSKGSLIGVSIHSLEEARRAERDGADFVNFGPIYPTSSKPMSEPKGLKALKEVCSNLRIPVFALGGIRPENARECLENGAYGVAVISAILGVTDITHAVEDFEKSLGTL